MILLKPKKMLFFLFSCLAITASGLTQIKSNNTMQFNIKESNSNFLPTFNDSNYDYYYDNFNYDDPDNLPLNFTNDTETVLFKAPKKKPNQVEVANPKQTQNPNANVKPTLNPNANVKQTQNPNANVKQTQNPNANVKLTSNPKPTPNPTPNPVAETIIKKETIIETTIYKKKSDHYQGSYKNYHPASFSDGGPSGTSTFLAAFAGGVSGAFLGDSIRSVNNRGYYGSGIFYYSIPNTNIIYASPNPNPPDGYVQFTGTPSLCAPTKIETVNCTQNSFSNSSIFRTFAQTSLQAFMQNGCVNATSTIADFFASQTCDKIMQGYATMKLTLGDLIYRNLTTFNNTLGTLGDDVINKVSNLTASYTSNNNHTFQTCTTSTVSKTPPASCNMRRTPSKTNRSWAEDNKLLIGLCAVITLVASALICLSCWLCCKCCKDKDKNDNAKQYSRSSSSISEGNSSIELKTIEETRIRITETKFTPQYQESNFSNSHSAQQCKYSPLLPRS